MSILQLPTAIPSTQGTFPSLKFMISTDDITVITQPGYLNSVTLEGFSVAQTDIIQLLYSFNQQTNSGIYTICSVTISNGVITLVREVSRSNVVLPTTSNHIAVYNNTTGEITEDVSTAINGGNIQAGDASSSGDLISTPGGINNGNFRISANGNNGNYTYKLTNASVSQDTVVTFPNPQGNASVAVITGNTSQNNFAAFSNIGGVLVDSGVNDTFFVFANQITAGISGNIGGDGAGPLPLAVAGLQSTGNVVANIQSSSNPVSVVSVIYASDGQAEITFSGDPGANCYVSFFSWNYQL